MSTQKDTLPPLRAGEGTMQANQVSSTKTCTIGCKLPTGFLMELGSKERDNYRAIKLNGINSAKIVGGFGITYGVPTELYDMWAKANAGRTMFKNGLIFKVEGRDDASVSDMAKTLKDQKTGMERLDPKKLPKGMADVQKSVTKLEI